MGIVKSTESERFSSQIDTFPVTSKPLVETQHNEKRDKNMVKQRKRILQPIAARNIGGAAPIKTLKLDPRFMKTGRSTTFKPAMLTESTLSSISDLLEDDDNKVTDDVKNPTHTQNVAGASNYKMVSSTNMPSYVESPRSAQDNIATISDNSRQVDDSSLSIENISGSKVTARSIPQIIYSTTEHPPAEATTTLSLIEELKRQLITISYDLTQEQSTEDTPFMTTLSPDPDNTDYEYDDFQPSESRSVINVHTADENFGHSETHTDTSTLLVTVTEDFMNLKDDIQLSNRQTATAETTEIAQPERSPKRIIGKSALAQLIEDSTTYEGLKESETLLPDEIINGQYHETNPGQYHEVNPGQYHETNPGQYHESNPGQYDEKNPGQDLGVDKITVNFDHGETSRSYNVKANAGDFIIGEVGRIDIDSGQTLEGVRYTAVDGEVDQARISDILEQYFGAQTN